jgi:hypothetical protein
LAFVTVNVRLGGENEVVAKKPKIKLQNKTKKELAVALFALGNFAGGSLVIGQVFGGTEFSPTYLTIGLICIMVLYPLAIYLLES